MQCLYKKEKKIRTSCLVNIVYIFIKKTSKQPETTIELLCIDLIYIDTIQYHVTSCLLLLTNCLCGGLQNNWSIKTFDSKVLIKRNKKNYFAYYNYIYRNFLKNDNFKIDFFFKEVFHYQTTSPRREVLASKVYIVSYYQ